MQARSRRRRQNNVWRTITLLFPAKLLREFVGFVEWFACVEPLPDTRSVELRFARIANADGRPYMTIGGDAAATAAYRRDQAELRGWLPKLKRLDRASLPRLTQPDRTRLREAMRSFSAVLIPTPNAGQMEPISPLGLQAIVYWTLAAALDPNTNLLVTECATKGCERYVIDLRDDSKRRPPIQCLAHRRSSTQDAIAVQAANRSNNSKRSVLK